MRKFLIVMVFILLIALLVVLVSVFLGTTYGVKLGGDRWEQEETYTDPDYDAGDGQTDQGEYAAAPNAESNTAGAKTKRSGLFSFLKKDNKKNAASSAAQPASAGENAAASGETGETAPGSTATPAPGATPSPAPGATAGASASPGASAGATPDTGKLTPAQVAGVLNQAFALQGLSGQASAVYYDSGVTVYEQTSIAYADFQMAAEADPDGEAAQKVASFLANETAYWSSTFGTIRAETGYTGGLSLVFVFTDGVEYPGI